MTKPFLLLSELSCFGKLVDEGGELSSFLLPDLEEPESLLGENVSFECNFPPALAMSNGLAENSGMLVVSIRKSSSVASELN